MVGQLNSRPPTKVYSPRGSILIYFIGFAIPSRHNYKIWGKTLSMGATWILTKRLMDKIKKNATPNQAREIERWAHLGMLWKKIRPKNLSWDRIRGIVTTNYDGIGWKPTCLKTFLVLVAHALEGAFITVLLLTVASLEMFVQGQVFGDEIYMVDRFHIDNKLVVQLVNFSFPTPSNSMYKLAYPCPRLSSGSN